MNVGMRLPVPSIIDRLLVAARHPCRVMHRRLISWMLPE
jgi:hypothetical protein